jgi:hypothetical protein
METLTMVRHECKKCRKGLLQSRVKRAFLIKIALFWLPIKRYKCNYCDKKSYLFGSSLHRREENKLQIV